MTTFRELQERHQLLGDKAKVLDALLQYLRLFPHPDTGARADDEFEFTDLYIPTEVAEEALREVMEELSDMATQCFQEQHELSNTPVGKGKSSGRKGSARKRS